MKQILLSTDFSNNAIVRLFRDATIKDIAKYTSIPFLILTAQD